MNVKRFLVISPTGGNETHGQSVFKIFSDRAELMMDAGPFRHRAYKFDAILKPEDVHSILKPQFSNLPAGSNACIVTHTKIENGRRYPSGCELVRFASREILSKLEVNSRMTIAMSILASRQIFDLLKDEDCLLGPKFGLADGFVLRTQSESECSSNEEVVQVLDNGVRRMAKYRNGHLFISVNVDRHHRTVWGKQTVERSKLLVVDLAINGINSEALKLDILTVGRIMRSPNNAVHLPFNDSTLTRLLKAHRTNITLLLSLSESEKSRRTVKDVVSFLPDSAASWKDGPFETAQPPAVEVESPIRNDIDVSRPLPAVAAELALETPGANTQQRSSENETDLVQDSQLVVVAEKKIVHTIQAKIVALNPGLVRLDERQRVKLQDGVRKIIDKTFEKNTFREKPLHFGQFGTINKVYRHRVTSRRIRKRFTNDLMGPCILELTESIEREIENL